MLTHFSTSDHFSKPWQEGRIMADEHSTENSSQKRTWKLTPKDRQEIVDAYIGGKSMYEIARLMGVSRPHIGRLLHKLNVKLRDKFQRCRRYDLDESVFDDAESNLEAAYWVGFLMADGCISDKFHANPLVQVGVAAIDGDHIVRYKSFLKSGIPIRITTRNCYPFGQDCHALNVTSRRLVDALARYGVVPRKSKTAKAFFLDNNPYFWAGMVDGDGSITVGKRGIPVLSLVGSESICQQFRDFIHLHAPECRSEIHRSKGIWGFITCGVPAVKILRLLYENNPYSLPRKKELAEKAMQWVPYCERGRWRWLTKETLLELREQHGSWREVSQQLKIDWSQLGYHRKRLIGD